MTEPVLLATLPPGHALRTRPLGQMRVQCRNMKSALWRDVTPAWGIARFRYDEMGPAWIATTEFRAHQPLTEETPHG